MFTWRKDRANISDEEPTFHVRYLGCTETYTPVGPGCTTRYVQKLWDNAPSERHLKRVAVKLGLGGIWVKGISLHGRSGDTVDKHGVNKARLQLHDIKHVHLENGSIHGQEQEGEAEKDKIDDEVGCNTNRKEQNGGEKKTKTGNKNDVSSSVTHFKMEDVSFCAADKSANDRIFCWISRCNREADGEAEGRVGPLEVHAVLCSTVDKAQTMAAVMSRAFQLAYKDWRAEKQRENRKQHQRKISGTASDTSSDSGTNSGKTVTGQSGSASQAVGEKTLKVSSNEGFPRAGSCDQSGIETNQRVGGGLDDGGAAEKPISASSSSSSLSLSAMSQHSASSSQNRNRTCTCADVAQDSVSRQEISTR